MMRKNLKSLRVLGVMTGTSCDGMDVACMEINLQNWQPLWAATVPYPQKLRKQVLAFQVPGAVHSTKKWMELHRDLGDWYALSLKKIIRNSQQPPQLIANHGQTLAHFPEKNALGMTLQLGDASRIAVATGLTVATQFREGDLAAGGQGAPLVPLFHQMLAHHLNSGKPGVAIHNLGGISNLTYIGPKNTIIAFDTGPGNVWIDAAAEKVTQGKLKFDDGGKLATYGQVDDSSLQNLLKHPYFKKPLPKSTGRDEFPSDYFFSKCRAKNHSLVTTATALTAQSIALAYEKWIIRKGLPLAAIYVCGGGAKNRTLMRNLQSLLPKIYVAKLSEAGFEVEYIEAQAFAIFGFLSLLGQPLGGSWTGAKKFGPPAHIIPGENWRQLQSMLSALLTT